MLRGTAARVREKGGSGSRVRYVEVGGCLFKSINWAGLGHEAAEAVMTHEQAAEGVVSRPG
jgi:hypothetical protein